MDSLGDAAPAGLVVARWEYGLMNLGALDPDLQQETLNKFGALGWEAVAFDFASRRVLMKRRAV